MIVKRTHVLRLVIVVLAIAGLGITSLIVQGSQQTAHAATSITGLHVSGNKLLNGSNQVVRALGVDRSGTEFECASSGGNGGNPFDGPSDSTSVAAMASWDMNAVRVPINEDCWLGINGFPLGVSTATYQQDIVNYVNLLNSNNMMAIVDLHWNAPGTTQATSQQIMPDLDHAPAFWTSVANMFKNNSAVIFDLYNEPHPANWSCWLNGSSAPSASPCSDVSFAVAGMQTLVNTVRNTGATNVLMLGGLSWSNDLSQWLQNEPSDPNHNLAASFHLYNFNSCNNTSCWNSQVAPVAAQVPVITGELGENDCAASFINSAMSWFDQNGVSYLGWAWVVDSCSGFPSLITNFNGTPTAFGQGLETHLQSLAGGSSTPTPTPTPNPNGSIAIDAGGSGAGNFVADTDFSGGTADTHSATVTTSGVTNPAPEEVYQTERYGDFTYTIAGFTANASYTVRLHFAETYWTATGQREFNVSINGAQVLSNFDIVAAAGGADKAVIEQFTENANGSGTFTLQFSSVVNYAKIDGIEILPNGSTPTPTPTPPPGAKYTFEDGGTDGWTGAGHIVSIANSTTRAHDGTHSLQIVLYSSSSSDFPSVSVPINSGGPQTGQTLTAWLYVTSGSVNVSAKLYVQDSNFQWHIGSLTSLTQGQWTQISFTIPSISGSANAVGVQLLASPINTNATVYLDTVNWG